MKKWLSRLFLNRKERDELADGAAAKESKELEPETSEPQIGDTEQADNPTPQMNTKREEPSALCVNAEGSEISVPDSRTEPVVEAEDSSGEQTIEEAPTEDGVAPPHKFFLKKSKLPKQKKEKKPLNKKKTEPDSSVSEEVAFEQPAESAPAKGDEEKSHNFFLKKSKLPKQKNEKKPWGKKRTEPDETVTHSDNIEGTENFASGSSTAPVVPEDENRPGEIIPAEGENEKTEKILLKKNKFPKEKKEKKPWSKKKKAIVFSCVGVVAALLIYSVVWAITIMSDPLAVLVENQPISAVTQVSPDASVSGVQPAVSATPDPEAILLSQADQDFLNTNYINIMLIGVDRSEDRLEKEWKGKDDFHSDVMIVLTINRTTEEVSMISLPRDTYAKIPGVDGIYKLNCAINCGGGWCKEGFEKVCQSAEWMLGGDGSENNPIEIDKYFAVDMNAVKELVDAIGGVDYDLEISFDNAGREYTKGFQHMNGQAVLDYLRVRKDEHIKEKGQSTDKHRVERQRRMLVEIFKKIQNNGLLASIPSLITAFEGNLEYNLTFSEISALAYYAINVDPSSIKSYSMSGSYVLVIKYADDPFAFTFTNQSNRVNIIEEVYNIDAKKRSGYSLNSLQERWGALQAKQFAKASKSAISTAKDILNADAAKPAKSKQKFSTVEQILLASIEGDDTTASAMEPLEETPSPSPTDPPPSPTDPPPSPTDPPPASTEPSVPVTTPAPPAPTTPPGGYRQYAANGPEWTLYNTVAAEYKQVLNYDAYSGAELLALLEQFRTDVIALCDMLGISRPSEASWKYDFQRKYNDIYVDMR